MLFVLLSLLIFGAKVQAQDEKPEEPKAPIGQIAVENNLKIAARPYAPPATIIERMALYKVPGLSIAVINGGKIEWAAGYGVLEAGKAAPVTPNSIFQAGSVSEAITAFGLVSLAQDKKIGLDADVNDSLQDWKLPQKVTLQQILSHSAGFNVGAFEGYEADKKLPTLLQVLNGENTNSPAIRIETEPGKEFRYSSGGFAVAGKLTEDLTGESFPAWTQRTIFDLLEMPDSSFVQPLPAEKRDAAASGHDENGKPIAGRYRSFAAPSAAGLWTTPSDLARFVLEVAASAKGKSNRILAQPWAEKMLKPGLGDFGLGFSVQNETFRQSGATKGFRCVLVGTFDGHGAVVMANGANADKLMEEILPVIARVYGWQW